MLLLVHCPLSWTVNEDFLGLKNRIREYTIYWFMCSDRYLIFGTWNCIELNDTKKGCPCWKVTLLHYTKPFKLAILSNPGTRSSISLYFTDYINYISGLQNQNLDTNPRYIICNLVHLTRENGRKLGKDK